MNEMLTYIFGHKNPDTDSVCAAIALSHLKNQLGMNTTPAVLGSINNETKGLNDKDYNSDDIEL